MWRSDRAIFFIGSIRERMVWRHQRFAGPGRRVVLPELLKGILEKVSPDGLQVVAEEIAEPEVLLVTDSHGRKRSKRRP